MCDLTKNIQADSLQFGEWSFANAPIVNLVVNNQRVTLTFENPSIRFVYIAVCDQANILYTQRFGVPSSSEQYVDVDQSQSLELRIRAYKNGEGQPVCVGEIVANVQRVISDGALFVPASA